MSSTANGPPTYFSDGDQGNQSFSAVENGRERRRSKEPGYFEGRTINAVDREDKNSYAYHGLAMNNHGDLGEESSSQMLGDSGTFLLPRTTNTFQVKNGGQKPSVGGSGDPKGKQKSMNGDIRLPKRSSAQRWSERSVHSSPLATEVPRDQERSQSSSRAENSKRNSELPFATNSWQSAGSDSQNGASSATSQTLEKDQTWRRSLGHDTDPTQLVNLALNLSEARRRNVSGNGRTASGNLSAGRRTVSPAQSVGSSTHNAGGGSLRTYLQEARRMPSTRSSRSGTSQNSKDMASGTPHSQRRHAQHTASLPPSRAVKATDEMTSASEATIARAQRARMTLELGYEHRRLLQYLPAMPKQPHDWNVKNRSKVQTRGGGDGLVHLGREYNPLQYIRNRRIRLREKKPLNPELSGWKDVERVRAWVDAVKNERDIGLSRVDNRYPLPPFEAVQNHPLVVDDPGSPTTSVLKDSYGNLLRRPIMDWVFSPWDLLADIHWLAQDRNMDRIEDPSGKRVFSNLEGLRGASSRLRNNALGPVENITTAIDKRTMHPDPSRALSRIPHRKGHDQGQHSRGHEARSSIDSEDAVRLHRSRWPKKLLRSRSTSSSDDSDWSHTSRRYSDHETSQHAILEKQMMKLIAAEAKERPSEHQDPQVIADTNSSAEKSTDGTQQTQGLRVRPQTLHRVKSDNSKPGFKPKASLDNKRLFHRRKSSDDLLSQPSSPTVPSLAPNIAVDVSPPVASSTSAISPVKRPFAYRLGSFRRDRSTGIVGRTVPENDTSNEYGASVPVTRQTTNESHSTSGRSQRLPNTDNDVVSLSRSDLTRHGSRFVNGLPTRNFNDTNASDSRLRGVFRGGRIAEIVGSEVSKVGDKLWKKESSGYLSQPDSPPLTVSDDTGSDSDDEASTSNIIRSSTNDSGSLLTMNPLGREQKRTPPTPSESHKYYISNLPSFRSPKSSISAERDRMPEQQKFQERRGRSENSDQLVPPKIDTRSASLSSSGGSRSSSQDANGDESRASSATRSTGGVRAADRRLNDMLGIPGKIGAMKPAPTGLTALSTMANTKPKVPRSGHETLWSIPDRSVSAAKDTVTRRDIARVRAILMSSGIKAHEIARRYEEAPESPSGFLVGFQDFSKGPLPLIPPSQENVFVARAMMMDIEDNNKTLRNNAEVFSNETVDKLHEHINILNDHVNNKLTVVVRNTADDADNFAAELTTTHTLKMKQLNDSIDSVLRKRRHRSRWLRRSLWAALEWVVVAVLWVAWSIAMLIQIARGAIQGTGKVIKWLFWL